MQKEELSLIEKILKKPHFIISILAIFIPIGFIWWVREKEVEKGRFDS